MSEDKTKAVEESGAAVGKLIGEVMGVVAGSISNESASAAQAAVTTKVKSLLGHQQSVHVALGGGKPADLLLWKDTKISAGVLGSATVFWIIFEWLDYHLLSLSCFVLLIGMVGLFLWTNFAGLLGRSGSAVPRIKVPKALIADIANFFADYVDLALGYLQDVASGKDLKQFIIVAISLWVLSMLGTWFNFLTVIYIGFMGAHTLPVLYDKYQDQVDGFLFSVFEQLQKQFQNINSQVRAKAPQSATGSKKSE